MEFKISGKHLEVTDPIREYAQHKTSKLHRYYDRIQSITVVVDQHDRQFDVELIVDVEHHDPFISRELGDNLYACVDKAIDKAERQLTDHKEKLRNRKHSVR